MNTLIRRVSNEGHTGSPPPQSPVGSGGTGNDPFAQQFADEIIASQSKEALDNTRRNSETASTPAPPAATLVLNPFQMTLATMEPAKGKDEVQKKREENSLVTSAGEQRRGTEFDVDSFTKMLMTGAAPPVALSHSRPSEIQGTEQVGAEEPWKGRKASNQSSGPNPSTSQPSSTSLAELPSTSSDDEAGRSDTRNTGPTSALFRARSPPPPPRHKHGKSVQESGPQTVSFADFDAISTNPQHPPIDRQIPSSGSMPSSRQASGSSTTGGTQDAASNRSSESVKRLRAPPPIPTARRTGSVKSQHSQDLETSSISSGQLHSPGLEPPPSPGLSKASRAPPPPPSRRAGNRTSLLPDQISASEMMAIDSENASLAGESIMSTDSSSVRQSRATAVLGSRGSSGSIPTTSQMPPAPPPPRRRRGSSKSSVEGPMSGDDPRSSQDGARRASGLSQVAESGTDSKAQADILADLSAFQAEVDALRAASLRKAG